jgi:hypothetical protein
MEVDIKELEKLEIVIKNKFNGLPVDIMGRILSYHVLPPCNNIEDCMQWFIIGHKIKSLRMYVKNMICNFLKENILTSIDVVDEPGV